MKTRKWRDVRGAAGKVSEKRLAEIDADVADEVRSIRTLREALGMTQAELAQLANMRQGEVSRFEQREDHKISRLRDLVEAMGGELEVVAVIGNKRVRVA
jgi:predicted transcriptional regulator